jgi:flagellar hook-associated protein 3 FlgL
VRITQQSASRTMLEGLQSNLGRMQRLQEQLSSGKQVSRPSDSPVKTAEAMQFRSEIRRNEQYVRNSDDGMAWLGTADSVLTSSLDMARRARDLTLQGNNDTIAKESRLALAAEIETLRDGLIGVANTTYLNRPIFAGNNDTAVAYDKAGTYQGDDGIVLRTVAPDTKIEVNVTGKQVFGEGENQLFAVLQEIATALRESDGDELHSKLDAGLGKLDAGTDRIITTLGTVGARYNRIETMRSNVDDKLIGLTTNLSEVEDIDLPKTIVDLQMQEVAYKAALGATARVVQPSLLDFLR